MKNKWKKIIISVLICSMSFSLTGCKPIFKQKVDKYIQNPISKEEIVFDTFYVKNGTKFIATYPCNKTTISNSGGKQCQIAFLTVDYKTVPTLYKGEIIAIASQNLSVSNVEMTRFKEIGYTIGTFNLAFDEDGYLVGTQRNNLYGNTSFGNFINENAKSDNFRIVSINGQEISSDMITPISGIFNCMEANKEYSFDYYSGTVYGSGTAVADTLMLEEYEYYNLTESDNTKNGYVEFSMPEDAKSGWYYIKDGGMFRYIDQPKGVDIATVEMNEPYYTSQEAQDSVYSQKFSTTFNARVKNVTLAFSYDDTNVQIGDMQIAGTVYAPDGTQYQLSVDTSNKYLWVDLEEAMAGKWTIYIQPKTLHVEMLDIESNSNGQEVTEENFPFVLDKEYSNYRFTISYEGNDNVYAVLVESNGSIHDFTLNQKQKSLTYDAPYIAAGIYQVKVYHYSDTNILDVNTSENTQTESDIITITE